MRAQLKRSNYVANKYFENKLDIDELMESKYSIYDNFLSDL